MLGNGKLQRRAPNCTIWLLGVLTWTIGAVAAATPDASVQDIYFLGNVPILFRLQLVVDGKPWQQARTELTKRQFSLRDVDGDGLISVEQLAGLPLPGFDPQAPQDWDTQVQDGRLSEAEFLSVFARYGQPSFLLAEGDSRAASRIKLFPHLDQDDDGKLTDAELAQAQANLARLDYDDDETISTTELAPFVNPLFQQAVVQRETPLDRSAPFLAARAFASRSELARALIKRYRLANEEGDIEHLSCKLAQFSPSKDLARFDDNQDGELGVAEVERYLSQHEPDVVLQIELPSQRALRAKIKLLADKIGASKRRPSRIRGSSRLSLQAADSAFDVRVQSSTIRADDNRNFYLLEFRRADEDKNGYLDANEYSRVGLRQPLDQVDLDGNEQVTRAEMEAFLDRDAFVSASQIVFSVAADTQTLFSWMDQNTDQRLTNREFWHARERLRFLDADRDGTIAMHEITQEYRILFSMGRPRVFQEAMSMQTMQNSPAPRSTPDAAAPAWFRKMDRNQDGDISWREFLGKRELFTKLDRDHDGLLTAAEVDHQPE